MFCKINENVWFITKPLKVYGVKIGTKMVIIKLSDGSLFVHSPVRLNAQEIIELRSMGEVKHIIAPNLMHHLYLKEFSAYFPSAKCYGPSGLDKKHKDIHLELLTEDTYSWSNDIQQICIQGAPEVNEIVFFSEQHSLVVLADLAFNIQSIKGLYNKLGHWVNDSYQKFGSSRHCRTFIQNQETHWSSVRKILNWDFDKITVGHGENILSQGKEIFKRYCDCNKSM